MRSAAGASNCAASRFVQLVLASSWRPTYAARMSRTRPWSISHSGLGLARCSLWLLAAFAGASPAAVCPAATDSSTPIGSDRTLNLALPGYENHPVYGNKLVFLHIPASYQVGQQVPLVVILHGAAGNPTAAIGQANVLLGLWRPAANAGGFIVASLVGSGTSGSWIAPDSAEDLPTDYDMIDAAVRRIASEYSIDDSRRYLWGFSAGGHVTLDIALNERHPRIHSGYFAGFGVNAGVSAGLACSGAGSSGCLQIFAGGPMKRPIDVHIGGSDSLIAFAVDDRARFQTLGWGPGVTFFWHEFAGGHYVLAEHPLQIWNNLCGFSTRAAGMPARVRIPAPGAAESVDPGTFITTDPDLRLPDKKR